LENYYGIPEKRQLIETNLLSSIALKQSKHQRIFSVDILVHDVFKLGSES